nr:putative ribonuclease H-like domain-containing protein [Tanacetum cinerariifolium]
METQKPLLKDEDGEEVDVHMYRSMIGSLMYLTSLRPDIMFAVCACVRYQVNPKVSHLHVMKRIFRKKVIITESTIRRDLQLEDADGVDCLPNATIFKQLTLMGKINRKVTEVPQPNDPTSVTDEAINKEMDDSLERASTTTTSLDAEQDIGNINKIQSKATSNESSSQGADLGDRPRRQETMRDTVAQTRSKRVSKISNDPLLIGVNIPRSVIEKEVDAPQIQVTTAATTLTISIGEVTLAQALTELRHIKLKAKAKGIVFHKPEESTTTATIIPKPRSQDKGKAKMIKEHVKLKKKDQIQLDEEIALKLQA